MKIRILQPAGEWRPGVHDVPDRFAQRLIRTGYAKALSNPQPDVPETSAQRELESPARKVTKREGRG